MHAVHEEWENDDGTASELTGWRLHGLLLHISWITRTKRSVAENLVELKGENRSPLPLVANVSARSISSADLLPPPALKSRSLLLLEAGGALRTQSRH